MIEVKWGDRFKRKYLKIIKKNPKFKEIFIDKIIDFCSDPFSASLKTHKLSGQFSDYWSFSIDYRTRVIFRFINDTTILLLSIGSHDEVY